MDERIRRRVRVALAQHDLQLADVVRSANLEYSRVQRVLGGYASPLPGEIEALLDAIDRLAARRRVAPDQTIEQEASATGQGGSNGQ